MEPPIGRDSPNAASPLAALQELLRRQREEADVQARLTSRLSHELRGSLNGMMLMLEVLRRELAARPEMARSLEDLSLVRQAIREMANELDRHSQLGQLQQDKTPPRNGQVELRQLLEETANRLADAARTANTSVTIDVPAGATAQTDPAMLATVVHQILDNALKHAPGSAVRLLCRRASGSDKPAWLLCISDAGPGMDQHRLQALLDARQRLERGERGYGLLIAAYAARRMETRIDAESQPGKGCTFCLRLPES